MRDEKVASRPSFLIFLYSRYPPLSVEMVAGMAYVSLKSVSPVEKRGNSCHGTTPFPVGRCRLSGGECRGNWEKVPGKRGLWVGEAGSFSRGNRNTAAAVHYNAARR